MNLNIVSRINLWDSGRESMRDGINIPASIPAYLAMEKANVKMVTTSELLTPQDYQSVWKESLLIVWEMIALSFKHERGDRPNIILIHSYSIFLLLAQAKTFERFLELCLQKYNIDELHIEDPSDLDDDDFTFYSPVVYSSYYHDIAQAWAADRKIKCSVIRSQKRIVTGQFQDKGLNARIQFYWKGRNVFINKTSNYLRGWSSTWLTRISNLSSYLLGVRHFIFYMPCRASGLTPRAPKFAVDASIVLKGCLLFQKLFHRDSPKRVELDDLNDFLRFMPADNRGITNQLVNERCVRYLKRTHDKGLSIFNCFVALLKRMHRLRLNIAYLATAPFVDWNYEGYITEAFRKTGCKIAGIQHGGNVRLQKHGGVVPILAGFMGRLYFQWGNACTDDHGQYGIKYDCRFVKTGSPRTNELLESKAKSSRRTSPGTKIKILYAPTLISVFTTYGSQVVWDAHIKIFKSVCEILNVSGHESYVKLHRFPEMECFDFSLYPRIHFLKEGGFVDYMWRADYLVVDSLGASPIYEALTTDKPILLYAAIENQVWDEEFIKLLKARVVCFFDGESFIKGIEKFVEDPKDYVLRSGIRIGSEIIDKYMPCVTDESFWSIIHESFFGLKAGNTIAQERSDGVAMRLSKPLIFDCESDKHI